MAVSIGRLPLFPGFWRPNAHGHGHRRDSRNRFTPTIDFLMNFSSRRHLVSVSRALWCSLGVNFDRKCSRETLRSDRSLRTPCVEMALRSAAARRRTDLDSGHRYVAHTSDIWAVFADIWPICLDTGSIGRYMADMSRHGQYWPI